MDTDNAAAEAAAAHDVDCAANTILLPEASITNGAGHDVQNLEFLEEDMLQNDPMADLNEEVEAAVSTRKTRSSGKKRVAPEAEGDEVVPEQEEVPTTRTPTQVPKKRRDAALLAAAAVEGFEEEEALELEYDDTEAAKQTAVEETTTKIERLIKVEEAVELPTSSKAKDNSVDEEQCRVCTTKDDLVSLFKKVESHTIAELLMIICPTVSIACKDFMPQYICNTCQDNVTIAVQLKNQCEATEKELRKKLSRSKNKVRRPTGYVVIDAPLESDPPSDEEPKSDIEFKVSDVEVSASGEEDSSGDSDYATSAATTKKKRGPRGSGRGGRGGGRRKSAVTPTPKPKEKKRMGRPPFRKTRDSSAEKEVGDATETPVPKKKKKPKQSSEKESVEKPTEFPCDECEQVFTRKLSLVLHKKAHSGGREPINCEVCGKQFKIQGAYRSHLEKHKDDYATPHNCTKCEKTFTAKADLRKHIAEVHEDLSVFFTCDKCKRVFTTQARLERHQENRCPGFEVKVPRRTEFETLGVGKDLFKSVAPLTTTYWSDSFSD